jgi:hypothetical protein
LQTLEMRRETSGVSFLTCPLCVRAPSSALATQVFRTSPDATSGVTGVTSEGVALRPDPSPEFVLPYRSMATFVVAILVGMLAAMLPARRASRLNVLEALQYE